MTTIWLLVRVLVVAGAALWFLIDRPSRRAAWWGAYWALPLGFWTVAPAFFHSNHIEPANPREWLVIDLGLAGAFALVGAMLGYLVCLPVTVGRRIKGRTALTNVEGLSAIVAVLLPPAYLAVAILLEWAVVSHPPSFVTYRPLLILSAPIALGLGGFAYATRRTAWWQIVVLVGLAAGVAALPMRVNRINPPARPPEPLVARAGSNPRAPLLILGIDSGTWRVLRPLIDQGRLPVFARMIAAGVHGDMHAAWPPYWSAPAWGAIVTGRNRDEIGVYEDLRADIPLGPTISPTLTLDPLLDPLLAIEFVLTKAGVIRSHLPGREALHAPPIWELLSSAGVKTGLVHFPFTYPARGEAALMISRRVSRDVWKMAGVAPETEGLVSPASESDKWRNWFSSTRAIDDGPLRSILPQLDWPKPRDSVVDPVEHLRDSWDLATRVLAGTGEVVRTHPDLDVVMTYVGSFDTVMHTFWQYRFPEDYAVNPPDPSDVAALGGVIDRFTEFLDASIGRLLNQFETAPNIIIVSDHGHAADHDSSLFRGFHASTGIFVASGPDIAPRPDAIDVSYFDIVPTILDLEGFEVPASLKGHPLLKRSYNPLQ